MESIKDFLERNTFHFCGMLQHFIYICLGSLCFFSEEFPVHPVPSKPTEGQAGIGSASEEMGADALGVNQEGSRTLAAVQCPERCSQPGALVVCSECVTLCCSQSWLLPVLVGAQHRSLLCADGGITPKTPAQMQLQ